MIARVTFDDPAVAQARSATDALRELEGRGRHLLADPSHEQWSGELLEELARLAYAVAGAVEVASGTTGRITGPDVTHLAAQLSDAILRRRQAGHGHGDGDGDGDGDWERPTSPALPAVAYTGEYEDVRRPKHRAHRHLRPVR